MTCAPSQHKGRHYHSGSRCDEGRCEYRCAIGYHLAVKTSERLVADGHGVVVARSTTLHQETPSPLVAALFLVGNGFLLLVGDRMRERASEDGRQQRLGALGWRGASTSRTTRSGRSVTPSTGSKSSVTWPFTKPSTETTPTPGEIGSGPLPAASLRCAP